MNNISSPSAFIGTHDGIARVLLAIVAYAMGLGPSGIWIGNVSVIWLLFSHVLWPFLIWLSLSLDSLLHNLITSPNSVVVRAVCLGWSKWVTRQIFVSAASYWLLPLLFRPPLPFVAFLLWAHYVISQSFDKKWYWRLYLHLQAWKKIQAKFWSCHVSSCATYRAAYKDVRTRIQNEKAQQVVDCSTAEAAHALLQENTAADTEQNEIDKVPT